LLISLRILWNLSSKDQIAREKAVPREIAPTARYIALVSFTLAAGLLKWVLDPAPCMQ